MKNIKIVNMSNCFNIMNIMFEYFLIFLKDFENKTNVIFCFTKIITVVFDLKYTMILFFNIIILFNLIVKIYNKIEKKRVNSKLINLNANNKNVIM